MDCVTNNDCTGGKICCGNTCVDPSTKEHCGGCNPCNSKQTCSNVGGTYKCVCTKGEHACCGLRSLAACRSNRLHITGLCLVHPSFILAQARLALRVMLRVAAPLVIVATSTPATASSKSFP